MYLNEIKYAKCIAKKLKKKILKRIATETIKKQRSYKSIREENKIVSSQILSITDERKKNCKMNTHPNNKNQQFIVIRFEYNTNSKCLTQNVEFSTKIKKTKKNWMKMQYTRWTKKIQL